MRAHPTQVNPYAQLDAVYAEQKAAAKREAANTRRKLLEFASALAGESDSEDACIVSLEPRQDSQEQEERQPPQKQGRRKKQKETADAEEACSISEWV